jgi:hypothetical protein
MIHASCKLPGHNNSDSTESATPRRRCNKNIMQQFIRRRVTHHSIRRKPCQLDKSKRLAIRKLSVDIRQVAQPFRRRQYFTHKKTSPLNGKHIITRLFCVSPSLGRSTAFEIDINFKRRAHCLFKTDKCTDVALVNYSLWRVLFMYLLVAYTRHVNNKRGRARPPINQSPCQNGAEIIHFHPKLASFKSCAKTGQPDQTLPNDARLSLDVSISARSVN